MPRVVALDFKMPKLNASMRQRLQDRLKKYNGRWTEEDVMREVREMTPDAERVAPNVFQMIVAAAIQQIKR